MYTFLLFHAVPVEAIPNTRWSTVVVGSDSDTRSSDCSEELMSTTNFVLARSSIDTHREMAQNEEENTKNFIRAFWFLIGL